ncbi:MAG: HD domain-containing phosphohydrolase [Gammaproteobacteria bacterium]|nr:HD domain-containing phosphohydrolase [Gammaproteobacteria bacterium]
MLRPISIRINILSNFLIIVGLVAALLMGLQYYFSQQLAISAAHKSFTQTAEKITQHIQARDATTKNTLYLTELYPGLSLPPMDALHSNTIKRFALNMQRSANIYAMYIGHPNGDFFEVINMNISAHLHKHFKAPEGTRWTVIRIISSADGRTRHFNYLDNNFHLLAKRSEKSDYLANKRPWFIQASQSDKAIRTDAYFFTILQQKGVTFAKVINGSKAVLAIDFSLTKLNGLLRQQRIDPSSELLLFGRDGSVMASSNSQTADKKINTYLTQLLKEGQTERIIRYKDKDKDEDKFAMVTDLSRDQSSNTHLGITINADVMLNPYLEQIVFSLAIAGIFLLFTIPLILYLTSRIVKPIKALMVQNHKIKDRNFDNVTAISSNIIEIRDLSDSLVSMSQSIQDYQKAQQELMDSFIRLIADAIDAKSSYTGGHCQRVPEIAMMLAKTVSESEKEVFKQFKLESDDAWREFEIGAWLHDCGKVTTPEYVVDKATKLETIYNRIHEIRTRFEAIWRDIEIEYYQRLINNENSESLALWRHDAQQALQNDYVFLAEANIGGEFMDEDKIERIKSIAQRTWVRHFNDRIGLSETELLRYQGVEEQTLPAVEPLLSDRPEHLVERVNFDEESYRKQGFKMDVPEYLYNYGELYNLCIEKGTLTDEERFKINEHVIMSIKMLETLPYPEHMRQIPEYAGTHHETMIGTGYPRKLSKEKLSIPARIMAIADIFEALTASDRPYKKGKKLSEALRIMSFMEKDQHIDGDLFALFLQSGIYKEYARKHLSPEQIDAVDIQALTLTPQDKSDPKNSVKYQT